MMAHESERKRLVVPQPIVRSPALRAAVTAGIYLVICAAYIVVSDQLAEVNAETPQELREISTVKGVAFVAVTAVGFYLVSLARWSRIRQQEETIIAQQRALVRREQRAAAGLYSAALAHDLGNFLFATQGLLDKLDEHEAKSPSLVELRDGLNGAIEGLSALSHRIATSARSVLPEDAVDVDVRECIDRLILLARHHPDLKRTSIRAVDVPAIRLHLNSSMFEDAMLNLLLNAGQATGPEGHVEVRVHDGEGAVRIEVHDDGPGIPEDELERIFEPLYTTKQDGTGLGLLGVRAFAGTCGGEVAVGCSELGGAMFTLCIPRDPPTASA